VKKGLWYFHAVGKQPSQHNRDHALATAFVLLLLFLPPVAHLWATGALPWYLPYLLWAVVLLLPLILHRFFGTDRERR